jgi:hypothetical protein
MFAFLRFFEHTILLKDVSDDIDLTSIYKEINKSIITQNRGNLITADKDFLSKNEKLLDIKLKLQTESESFLRNAYQLDDNFTGLNLTNSWVNISRKDQFHHAHEHPFSVVSGVLFLDDCLSNYNFNIITKPPDVPYFMNRSSCSVSLSQLIDQNNLYCQYSSLSRDDIRNNLKNYAIFFLSNVTHSVTPILEDEVRRTLSFNTFFKGITGNINDELSYINY